MFDTRLSPESLQAWLADVPPVILKGLALIEHPSLLADREAVRTAVVELIGYSNRCAQAANRLRDLPPIPLTAFVSVEWCL